MKSTLKNTILILVGIVIGALISTAVIFVVNGIDKFWKPQIINVSSEEITSKISIIGIPIPEKAYNIDFYYIGFQDYTCCLAFSASEAEITKTIEEMKKIALLRLDSKAKPEIPLDKKGNKIINWWPENNDNLEIFSSDLFWIGHDKKNNRIYIYKFDT